LNATGAQTGSHYEHVASKLGPINYSAAFHGGPGEAAGCAERCTDETGALTVSRCILHVYSLYIKE
jgi:hypothetical protein